MIKYVTYKKLEKEKNPFVSEYSLYFSDKELTEENIDFIETEIKKFPSIFAELNSEKCKIKYKQNMPCIIITVKFNDLIVIEKGRDINKIINETRDLFIDHYNKVVLINLKNESGLVCCNK